MKPYHSFSLLFILLLVSVGILLPSCQPETISSIPTQTEVPQSLVTITATAISQAAALEPTSTISATETSTTMATPVPPSPTSGPTYTPKPITTPIPAPPALTLNGWLVFSSVRLDTNGDGVLGIGDGQHLHTVDLATGKETPITSGEYFDTEPSWSPDGNQIVFSSNRTNDGSFDLFVVNRDGSDMHQITSIPENARNPVWSPDGSHIAFVIAHREETGYETRQIGLYFIYEDRTEQITTGADTFENSSSPAWSPDGRYLTFSHVSKSLLASSHSSVNINLVDIKTFEEFTLVQGDELSYTPANPQWIPGEEYILTWEANLYTALDLLLYDLQWLENQPVLRQLPIVLTDLIGSQSWTTNGEWLIYELIDDSKASVDWFGAWEIGALPINLRYRLSSSDGHMKLFSLHNIGQHQLLTDNQFLNHQPNWISK